MLLSSPKSYEGGFIGRCPRCNTDGPCREETGYLPGWPDFGFEDGDTCIDRPFANKAFAVSYVTTPYYAGLSGGITVRYWTEDGEVKEITSRNGRIFDWNTQMDKLVYYCFAGQEWACKLLENKKNEQTSP